MTLTAIKKHNRTALLRVLATLFAMIGLVQGGMVATLPRHLRLSVLRLLRPLESAVRRLVVAEAQGMSVEPRAARSGSASRRSARRGKTQRKPSFPVADPLQRTGPPAPRYVKGPGPRISSFDGFDQRPAPPPEPTPDDPMDAAALCGRLHALSDVLENLSKYAARLARWHARRESRTRVKPLRPGRPPGFRRRAVHEIDEILRECHEMALMALAAPDTS